MKITIATLLRAFRIGLARPATAAARPRTITVVPKDGVDVVILEKRASRGTASAPSRVAAAR